MKIHARLPLLLLLAVLAAPALAADVDATPPTPPELTGFADIQRWYSARGA